MPNTLQKREYSRAAAEKTLRKIAFDIQSQPQTASGYAARSGQISSILRSTPSDRQWPVVGRVRNPFDVSRVPTGDGLFAQHPTKAEIMRMTAGWTQGMYYDVQSARRKGALPMQMKRSIATQKLNLAMAMHMKKFALRAPAMPPKVRDVETGSATPALYRGLLLSPDQMAQLFSRDGLREKGYMAFSRDKRVSLDFASSFGPLERYGGRPPASVLLRLDASTVPAGTPWIWFASHAEMHDATRPHGGNTRQFDKTFTAGTDVARREMEVLLPPGTLRMVSHLPRMKHQPRPTAPPEYKIATAEWQVRYEPDLRAASLWATRNGGPGRPPVRQSIV